MGRVDDMHNELLDFLASQATTTDCIRPDDVTIHRLREKMGGSEARAARVLVLEVKAGRLVKVLCRNDAGHLEYAYRRPE